MFSIYGPTGREFKGTLEQMRRVSQVHAADRARAIEPTARDGHDSALREAVEFGAPLTATTAAPTPHRAAAAAYAASQQPVHHAWHELLVSEVMHAPVLTVRADGRVDHVQIALQLPQLGIESIMHGTESLDVRIEGGDQLATAFEVRRGRNFRELRLQRGYRPLGDLLTRRQVGQRIGRGRHRSG